MKVKNPLTEDEINSFLIPNNANEDTKKSKLTALLNRIKENNPLSTTKNQVLTSLVSKVLPHLNKQEAIFSHHRTHYNGIVQLLSSSDRNFLLGVLALSSKLPKGIFPHYTDFTKLVTAKLDEIRKPELLPEIQTLNSLSFATTVFGVFSYLISDNPYFSFALVATGFIGTTYGDKLVLNSSIVESAARNLANIFHPTRRSEVSAEYEQARAAKLVESVSKSM